MKLRIHKDSIRFRFTRAEALELSEGKTLAECVAVGPLEGQQLHYRVVPLAEEAGEGAIRATLADNILSVFVPRSLLVSWYEGEELAIGATQRWNGSQLRLLLEKDMQRLNPKPGEEPAGVYSHPLFGKVRCEHP